MRTTEQDRAALKALGYEVEDMGKVYGAQHEGQWRWILLVGPDMVDFQDGDTSDSEEDAWTAAVQHRLDLVLSKLAGGQE